MMFAINFDIKIVQPVPWLTVLIFNKWPHAVFKTWKRLTRWTIRMRRNHHSMQHWPFQMFNNSIASNLKRCQKGYWQARGENKEVAQSKFSLKWEAELKEDSGRLKCKCKEDSPQVEESPDSSSVRSPSHNLDCLLKDQWSAFSGRLSPQNIFDSLCESESLKFWKSLKVTKRRKKHKEFDFDFWLLLYDTWEFQEVPA